MKDLTCDKVKDLVVQSLNGTQFTYLTDRETSRFYRGSILLKLPGFDYHMVCIVSSYNHNMVEIDLPPCKGEVTSYEMPISKFGKFVNILTGMIPAFKEWMIMQQDKVDPNKIEDYKETLINKIGLLIQIGSL